MSQTAIDPVGQSVMLSFAGTQATAELRAALAQTRAAGVILFAHNIGTPAELHALCTALQSCAAELRLPPLLIAIDQEGGIVSRLPAPFVTPPSQMAQAATDDPVAAYACAQVTGQQLRAYGVNVNFAPVLDVNNNPANPVIGTRAFGADPATVTRFGLAALRGYRETGVVATAKHFPGHGDTTIDSHLDLPVLDHERARLDQIELAPFKAAIAAGVPAIMTAHIVFNALDDCPATLSRRVLRGLLRGELGFTGVVFTDALDMRAIADHYGKAEAAVRAKAAGTDVVLPLGTLAEQVAVVEALRDALRHDRIPLGDFVVTAQRLNTLRASYRITHSLPPYAEPDSALLEPVLAVARRSITVRDAQGILPLPSDARLTLIDCLLPRFSLVEEEVERADRLRSLVQAAFPGAISLTLQPEASDDELAQTLDIARTSEVLFLVTRNACFVEQQAQLAAMLAHLEQPLIHAAVRNPQDADRLPNAAVSILTYGDPPLSLRAMVDVLRGV
ncbi:MAG: beta-N-acetylhexosaminidase [Chloroflexales bacterium]|nr:beta-N-acetylhexosaminidase [Chloroflexales bacterium]